MLVLEEPWVTRDVPAGCDHALTAFYQELRTAPGHASAATIIRECQLDSSQALWGFERDEFESVLASIERQENLDIVAFAGASFGAVRWAYTDVERYEWTVLVRPFPIGVSGQVLIETRASLIDEYYPYNFPELMAVGGPLGARSVPLREFDAVSGRIFAGVLGRSPASSAEVGEFSDRFWQRYSDWKISSALLAYWDEVCTSAADWPTGAWTGEAEDTYGFLAAFHAPCAELAGPPVRLPLRGRNVCIVVSDRDSVTPGSLAADAFARLGATIIRSAGIGHLSRDGFDLCVNHVAHG